MKKKYLCFLCIILNFLTYGQLSKEVRDVMILSKAGITNTIIKAYIDGFTNKIELPSTNLIHLKQAGVSDDILIYLLHKKNSIDCLYINRLEKIDDMDSKEFFYRYYLIPRAERTSDEMRHKK